MRSRPVDELQQRLAELAVRQLVTLTGPGGVGKIRLATEIAWSLADDFPGGAWMVELAPLGNLAAVVPSVASALSVQPRSGMTMEESIIEWFRPASNDLVPPSHRGLSHVGPTSSLMPTYLKDRVGSQGVSAPGWPPPAWP